VTSESFPLFPRDPRPQSKTRTIVARKAFCDELLASGEERGSTCQRWSLVDLGQLFHQKPDHFTLKFLSGDVFQTDKAYKRPQIEIWNKRQIHSLDGLSFGRVLSWLLWNSIESREPGLGARSELLGWCKVLNISWQLAKSSQFLLLSYLRPKHFLLTVRVIAQRGLWQWM
jgi:hypothetical protein